MRKLISLICLISIGITSLLAQNNNGFTKNTIEVKTLTSTYENILGKNFKNDLLDFLATHSIEDLNMNIKFTEGLETIQYSEKKESDRFFYVVKFYSPKFKAIIHNKDGEEILNQEYGGEKISTEYGKEDNYVGASNLSKDWRINRDEFYKKQELKQVPLSQLKTDLKNFTTEENSIEKITTESEEDKDEIKINKDSIYAIESIDSSEIVDTSIILEPKIKEPRNLRNHNMIISVGLGLGNQRNYKLSRPTFGASIDRYSFHNEIGKDWVFIGGWVGLGKYTFDANGLINPIDVTEISFISRYGISITRILQDANKLNQLTELVDIYALVQFGYAFVSINGVISDFVDTTGTSGGFALGTRYNWKNIGAFAEVGKTETGYAKAGIFLKL